MSRSTISTFQLFALFPDEESARVSPKDENNLQKPLDTTARDAGRRRLYVFPVPMVGVVVNLGRGGGEV